MERREIPVKLYVFKGLDEGWRDPSTQLNRLISARELIPVLEELVELGLIPEPLEEDCYLLEEIKVVMPNGGLPVIEVEGKQFVIRMRPGPMN